jgi:hypothetical protein
MANDENPPKPRAQFNSTRGKRFGTLQKVFDDVWWVWGTTRFLPGATFPRNMTIVRGEDGLVVIHPVLLPEAEQAQVEALGKIEHIVRLGDFHGMDDALYIERYSPRVWAPPGATPYAGVRVDHELVPGGELPLPDASLIAFDRSRSPETALLLPRHGGLLLTCDSIQSWAKLPEGVSLLGGLMAKMMGFRGRACIGPGWRGACEPKDGVGFGPKFREILELEFRHLIGAHGPPIVDDAKEELRRAVDRLYPSAGA